MYSRSRARVPPARQGGEQYDLLGLPRPAGGGSAPPQARHLAAWRGPPGEDDDEGGGEAGDAAGERAEGPLLLPLLPPRPRLYPLFRHGSEQYLTDRLGAWNALPHSAHRTRRARDAASLSALFSHRAQ